ncbi:hypothetical protein [Streptomyces sp. KL118A]|uniref:hypothetical protein n=1 Tax=Streptomyces sp. KL118A TaxID=3045153 RepID=UPI00278C025C|nr:hypothetical protein [Streptomyces sp. KL118A]
MGLLLIFMDRVEGMLDEDSAPPSGRHRRHLRLIPGHAGHAGSPRQSGRHREGRRDDEAA